MATTVKKTKKYYRDELAKGNISVEILKEIVKKFGTKKQYKGWKDGVTHTDYELYVGGESNWNHRIHHLEFTNHKKLYVDIYWQGDSTDGDEYIEASEIWSKVRYNRDYVIPAEWDEIGGEWGRECRHSPIHVTRDEFNSVIKNIINYLTPESSKKKTEKKK